MPEIAGLDEVEYHTSDTVMRLEELPERMVIVGGGYVAAEFAHVFSALGTRGHPGPPRPGPAPRARRGGLARSSPSSPGDSGTFG